MNVEGEQKEETKGWRKGLKKVGNWLAHKDHDTWLKDIRGNLSLVATVIATITFQSALNPPGGVRPPQENGIVACQGLIPCPGESVLAYTMAEAYTRFLICNTICFISSSAVCLWLVSGLTLNNRFFNWLLSIGMCVTISSLALTYMYGAQMVTPNPVWTTSTSMFGIVILVWLALLGVVVVVHSLRLFGFRASSLEFGRQSRSPSTSASSASSYSSGSWWKVVIHHGGKFVNEGYLKYEGESDTMLFYPDVWSYFVVVSVVKSLGYDGFKELWFSVGCGPVLDDRLEPLFDDVGVMHMVNLAQLNGKVHLYVVHTVSEAEVIHMIEYSVDEGGDEVAPQVNEGGEGAQVVEGIDDGVRQQLDEGVSAHGQRAEMTEANENEGERIEAQEGDVSGERIDVEGGYAERTEAYEVQVEEVEVEEADEVQVEEAEVEEANVERTKADEVHEEGEGKRIEVQEGPVEAERIEGNRLDGEGDRLDGEAYTIEVEDLEDIEVEVHDCSTSRDGDDGLVDINVQCDVRESCTDLEVEVEPFLPGSESNSEEDEINDSSWFNDEWESEDLTLPDISDEESEDEDGYGHFSTFTMPKKMLDFNSEVGTYFVDKQDILDAIKTYAVENEKNLKLVNNDKNRIRVKYLGSKGECPWVAYFGFMDAVKSWQLRTMVDRHTCSKEHKLRLFNAKWLSRKLEKTIRENPNLKGVNIRDTSAVRGNDSGCFHPLAAVPEPRHIQPR
ncbi:hypothetical protein V8G54_036959 [Vigna mungo]|uniref:PGG domain-containing protein n=1 Tax=Vigna mungo TaxID=3915 RepID=A0AAQ3MID5_VIGMU